MLGTKVVFFLKKLLFIGIDFSKEKFDATIILACGMKESGSRAYGSFPNDAKKRIRLSIN
ncbi:hypothetical protein FACS1894176_08370 [Bacteroidia bacterium]|nr:hypothetical protein FACS1894176_08370 [Bacteroidia bacterium]